MKTIKLTLYICLVAFLATSCIKDNSVGEINPISKIEMTGKMDTLFTIDRWETLRIAAPELKQTNVDKPLAYSWEIDHKEVSKEKDLTYVCEKFGVFDGRLKVTNEDGFFYRHFKVDVRYSYIKGVYILAQHNNKTILSYYPEGIEGKKFELDIYEKNNPLFKLGTEPKALFITNTPVRQQAYIATGNPAVLYRLDGNLMTVTAKMDTGEEEITFITDDGVGSSITNIIFIINKRIGNLQSAGTVYTNSLQQSFERTFGTLEFGNRVGYWRSPDNYKNGELYFDNLKSRMLINSTYASTARQELFKTKFANLRLIDFCPAGNSQEFAAVFKNKQTGEFVHFWFYPGYYYKYNTAKQVAPEIKYQGTMPATSGIAETSVMASAPAKNILYYTNGNKVYAYSILSKGNFPTQPTYVCGNGGQVASMFVNNDESKLYVGVNDNNPNLPGSIYCFDINKNELLWKQENVTGKICQMAYKYN